MEFVFIDCILVAEVHRDEMQSGRPRAHRQTAVPVRRALMRAVSSGDTPQDFWY
jgi:hypothetical protein